MAKLACHKTLPLVITAQGWWLTMHRPYIISKHAKIAEIRELENVAISSLGWTNYFGFVLFSMFNNRNLATANATDYSNLGLLVRHKYEIDRHNMATKEYTKTMDYNWIYLNTRSMAHASTEWTMNTNEMIANVVDFSLFVTRHNFFFDSLLAD